MDDTNKQEGDSLRESLDEALAGGNGPRVLRFALACLGGIPVVGGAISGAGSAWSEQEQKNLNDIFAAWLRLQEDEVREIAQTVFEVMAKLDTEDERIKARIESLEYLKIIKKCFRDWSAAESEVKRVLVRNLLIHAAASILCKDDIVKLFIQWIDFYSEAHFKVIRCIYKNPGFTRYEIWIDIHGPKTSEDSPEADLFKLLMHDLSTGHILRQHREKDYYGNFLKTPSHKRARATTVMTSAFDNEKGYELTELGKQFVFYTMEEIVAKLGSSSSQSNSEASGN
jgi:hypothetical protein